MNRDPFLRLALIVGGSLYVLGLVLVAQWLGFWLGFFVYAGGTVIAAAVSVVVEPSVGRPEPRRRRRQPEEGTRGFERIQ